MNRIHYEKAEAIKELKSFGYYLDNMSPPGREIYSGGVGAGRYLEIKAVKGAFEIKAARNV